MVKQAGDLREVGLGQCGTYRGGGDALPSLVMVGKTFTAKP